MAVAVAVAGEKPATAATMADAVDIAPLDPASAPAPAPAPTPAPTPAPPSHTPTTASTNTSSVSSAKNLVPPTREAIPHAATRSLSWRNAMLKAEDRGLLPLLLLLLLSPSPSAGCSWYPSLRARS